MSQILFIMDTTRVSTFATFFKIESRLTWHADRHPSQTTEQPGQQQQDGGQATHFFSEKHHLQSQFFSFFILVHFYRQKMYLFNYLCLLASCCVLFSMPPLFEIETKFYSKLWAALQEFATFYIWSTETKYIVFFGKCLVKRKYESFWQSLNLSPAEGFESHIRPKSDVFPLLKITQFEFWRVSKTRPFKFSVKSWRGVLATIRNNPSTKHGEPFRLILGSDKSSPTYLVSHSLQVIFVGTIDLEMICKPLADG